MNPFLAALTLDGTLCSLGIPEKFTFDPVMLTLGRRRLTSSGVGGTLETREMLAFCAEHQLLPEIERVGPAGLDRAFERLGAGDARYRFVLYPHRK